MNDKYKLVPVEPTASPTSGMNLGQRIQHVGGWESERGTVEFGSVMAVGALVSHILRDIAVQGEPIGWYTEDHFDDKSATTYSAEVAQRWRDKGWPVWPLYTAQHPAEQQPAPDVTQLVDALESLIKGYVGLLEAGRDRITSLGGDCDSVAAMEQTDPWLRDARKALATYRIQGANP